MNAAKFMADLQRKGIILWIEGSDLKFESARNLTESDLQAIRECKSSLVDYIRWNAIKTGANVETEHGPGIVWETHPKSERIGLLLKSETWPMFFPVERVSVKGTSIKLIPWQRG